MNFVSKTMGVEFFILLQKLVIRIALSQKYLVYKGVPNIEYQFKMGPTYRIKNYREKADWTQDSSNP